MTHLFPHDSHRFTLPPAISLFTMQVLPPTIAHLTSLTALDVSSNDLEELPLGLAGLYRLQHVKLDRNKLYCLPAVLLRLPDLRSLSASWNRIVALSADVSCLRQVLGSLNLV